MRSLRFFRRRVVEDPSFKSSRRGVEVLKKVYKFMVEALKGCYKTEAYVY